MTLKMKSLKKSFCLSKSQKKWDVKKQIGKNICKKNYKIKKYSHNIWVYVNKRANTKILILLKIGQEKKVFNTPQRK